MKSIATLIVCVMAAFSVAAQGSGSATFFAQEGEKFWVIMDGIKQNEKADANVRVTGLTKDNYQVKIIFADSKLGSFNMQVYTRDYEDKFADVTYKIAKNKKGVYVANINSFSEAISNNSANSSVVPYHSEEIAPAETRPVTTPAGTGATINQNVNMTGTGANTSQTISTPEGDNVRMDMNIGATGGGVTVQDGDETINMNLGFNVSGMDMGAQGNVNTNSSTTITKTTTTTTTTYSGTGGNVNTGNTRPPVQTSPVVTQPVTNTPPPANTNNGGCTFPASSTDMANLKGSIQKQSFADNKMNVAKTFIKNKCLSVAQIKEVMGLFSFEDNKLEFAKAAYDRCSDKENYYMVGDALTFSSSQDELTDFINSK